ncbi:TadE/TadG family type IV pilus assembly protein [Kribbella pratensis]|jgi:Flp pilus assembly protein TadG|uniref:TadE-like protein n=1 Tax=Kribbella pratensis TaxID=2512112 RepID=A0A4R8CJC5_9ACTN|nr:TadE/TadG family type IV pilus assembly protein [Kribbella pratensis]TDW76346.1 TadE-like protein [Kribbella pratensis]
MRSGGLKLRRRRSERGVSTLELAILAPAILTLIFLSIQTALWLYGRSVALNAAEEGVSRLRLVQPTVYTTAVGEKVRSDIQSYAAQLGGTTLQHTEVPFPAYNSPEGSVSFTVTGDTVSLVPGLKLKVSRTATGQIEQFQADK